MYIYPVSLGLASCTNGVARNFDWEGPKLEKICDIILVTFFGNLMVMISLI